jgi:hypothetical protein
MKTKITILIFLGVWYAGNIQAKLKYFLPQSDAVMSILDRKFRFEGDTIIENKRYTKVYRQSCYSEAECSNLYYYAAVREDTIAEKIYCIQVDDGIERLLADFAVKAGDEVTVYDYWFSPANPQGRRLQIENVDSILIDNQYRKRVNIEYHGRVSHDSWVEGFGSIIFGLFFPYSESIPDATPAPAFLCLHIADILIYQNDWLPRENTCYYRVSYGGIQEHKYTNFTVYPTLVDDKLYVEKKENSCSYKIINIQGTIVKSGVLSEEYILVSNFVSGIYYITFYNENHSFVYSGKFIKR